MTQATVQQHRGGVQPRVASPAAANSFRLEVAMDRLVAMVKLGKPIDIDFFSTICLSLSRGIDYAVANEQKPSKAQSLPALVKQICELKGGDHTFQAYKMLLLISVKNACKVGWFTVKETDELFTLINELARTFCSTGEVCPTAGSLSIVGTVMKRFYPHMKLGHIFTTMEVKPGYGVYTNDFHILKKTPCSKEDKIRLLVIQVDNLDTSACIISPQQVNFVINGLWVEKRNTCFMDTGPQIPTNVTPLLKFGTNLLQAGGQFNGNYIVVIAFMGEVPLCDKPILQDHIQPIVDRSESDPELIEGPSRISLNCPISFSRIKLPVKGQSCKHLQCFDFSNFIDINSRRPSWRCPHCNQSVCYLDIRIDQSMVKILKEVGDDISDVIISADGSWKPVFENDDRLVDQTHDTNISSLKEAVEPLESKAVQNALSSVIDLAKDDDAMDVDNICGIEDIKPFSTDLSVLPQLNNTNGINQNAAGTRHESSWQGLDIASGLAANALLDNHWVSETPQPTQAMLVQSTSVSPAVNHEADHLIIANDTPPEMQNYLSSPANFQSQQMQLNHPTSTNEYGSFPLISRTVSRTPIAVQALPALSQSPGVQRLRPSANSASNSNTASQAGSSLTVDGFSTMFEDRERGLIQPLALTLGASVSSRPLSMAQQSQNLQDLRDTNQATTTYRSPSFSEFQNPHLRQAFSPRPVQQLVRTLSPMGQLAVQQGIARASSVPGSQHGTVPSTVQRPPHLARQNPLSTVQTQSPSLRPSLPTVAAGPSTGTVQPDPRASSQADLASEQNWRPTSRMRGSLSGRDYSQFKDIMIQPTQSTQPARPPPAMGSQAAVPVPPMIREHMANNRTADSTQPHNNTNW